MKIIRRFIEAVKKLKEKKYIWIPATILFWLMPAFYLFEAESFHTYPVNFIEKFLPERISVVLFDLILFYIFRNYFFLSKKALDLPDCIWGIDDRRFFYELHKIFSYGR